MIFKMTRGADKLTKLTIEYLDKEKNLLNAERIKLNKLKASVKKDPTNFVLVYQSKSQQGVVQEQTKRWETREGSGFRPSGFIREELIKEGFESVDKQEQFNMALRVWNTRLESQDRKKTHVGLRRFIFSPDPKELKKIPAYLHEDLLNIAIDDAMKKFREKYVERGDRIGFLSSIHVDTDEIHAHIYLFPYTKNGKYLSMNASRYLNKEAQKKFGRDRRVDINDKQENKLDSLKTMFSNSFKKELVRIKELGIDVDKSQHKVIDPFNSDKRNSSIIKNLIKIKHKKRGDGAGGPCRCEFCIGKH